ncbi:MAG: helix-turn-helix domain-containing protein [Myxococcales bacterium]|nr:helix-turn-helix domain-containing protein [Myxococcales bacterium]
MAASICAWARLGIACRQTLRAAIDAGDLRASRPTAKTVILRSDLLEWLGRYPAAQDRARRRRERAARASGRGCADSEAQRKK